MNREFNDELLSAYLDGELSAPERSAVESELSANPQARQLLDELESLSQQVRQLPRQAARPDFADRVVQAAIAAKAEGEQGQTPGSSNGQVQLAPRAGDGAHKPASFASRRRVRVVLTVVAIAATAAVVLITARPWLGGGNAPPGPGTGTIAVQPGPLQPVASAAEAALASLRQALPGEGEAVVIRLRLAPGQTPAQALDQAFTAAGINFLPGSDTTTGAIQFGSAYQQAVAAKFGGNQPGPPSPTLLEGTIAAADAVFVEASWESLQKAVGALAGDPQHKLDLCPLSKIAAQLPVGGNAADGEGPVAPAAPKPANFAQRLPARVFRLDKAAAQLAETATLAATPIDGQRKVRLLILVEPSK